MSERGLVDRLRARCAHFDHIMRADEHYRAHDGNFFAAALTYYTIFALFPLFMVGCAVTGFLLSRRPHVLTEIDDQVRATVSGDVGQEVVDLLNTAIASRASVGAVGLMTAALAGLSWVSNLREAESRMWEQHSEPAGFLQTKLSDSAAMIWAFLLILSTIALTAVSDTALLGKILRWLGSPDFPALEVVLRGVSTVMSLIVSWLLFTSMIARLPRKPVDVVSSMRAGVIAALGFELFKQVGSIYLHVVLRSPAGATFGPVLGVMAFAYITARLVLFATAWAATSAANLRFGKPDPQGHSAPSSLVNSSSNHADT